MGLLANREEEGGHREDVFCLSQWLLECSCHPVKFPRPTNDGTDVGRNVNLF